MIKRIIIYIVVFVIVVLAAVLNIKRLGDAFLFIVIAASFIFALLMIGEVIYKLITYTKPENKNINYQPIQNNVEGLNKISSIPFLFGLEKKMVSDVDLYFDDQYLYAFSREGKAQFPLSAITELKRTSTIINNRPIWCVKVKSENDEEIAFNFTHNYTIWNKNFVVFYEKIKALNPAAIKSTWTLWRM